MEINDKTNLQKLAQSLSFKPLGSVQTSFISELDVSLSSSNIAAEEKDFSAPKPVDVKKEEPIVKEEKENRVEDKKADSKEDAKTTTAQQDDSDNQETNVDKKEENTAIDVDTDSLTINSYAENVDVVKTDVADDVVLDVVESDVIEEVGEVVEDGLEAAPKTFSVTSEDAISAAYIEADIIKQNPENAKSIEEIKSLFVEGSMASDSDLGNKAVLDAAADQLSMQEVVDADGVEVSDAQLLEIAPDALLEEAQVIKSPEVVKQERELAEKLPTDAKLNVEVKVEEEGFDFSKPQIIAKEEPVQKPVVESVKTYEVRQEMLNGQAPVADVAKAVAAVQPTALNNGVEIASKSSANNIAPIGFEAAKSVKSTTNTAEVKQTSNDNLRGLSKQVIEQVKVNITKSAVKGVDVIDVSLKPEELGKLNIKMEVNKNDGSIDIHIAATSKEVVEILQKDISTLQKAFEEAGFKLSDESFSFSYNQENQSGDDNNRQARMNFMADALSADLQGEEEIIYEGNNALNIKV